MKAEATAKLRLNYFVFVRALAAPAAPSLAIASSGSDVTVSFPTEVGFSYTVEFKTQLSDAIWQSISPAITGDGTTKSMRQPHSLAARYFRVRAQ